MRDGTVQYDFSPSATQTLYDNVKYIAFRDTYGAADANYYYQQRWNAHDQDEAPDVREMLGEIKDEQLQCELFEPVSYTHLDVYKRQAYRKTKFYEILGKEYIPLAFQYAHEADPDAELYYNDYSMAQPGRRDAVVKMVNGLKKRGIRIDAVGMQGHIGCLLYTSERR